MSYQTCSLAIEDGLARLTVKQPDRGNPFDADFCADIATAADDLAEREDVRAVLFTTQGQFFSIGGDINMFAENVDTLSRGIRQWTNNLHMGIARLSRLDAPIVTAVHATAMGGSVALISNFDLVFAARSAQFGAAYAKIGYSCDAGASFGLASRMGIARARRFLLLAETLDAESAAAAGLVDQIVDDEALHDTAEAAARRLSQGPTQAYAGIRKLMRDAFSRGFESQLEDEAQMLAKVACSEDAREGVLAFSEKRKPNFTGR